VTFVTAPFYSTPTDADSHNDYVLEITASDGTLSAANTVTVTVTQKVSGGGSSTSTTTTSTVVEVNGQKQDAGTSKTETVNGKAQETIKVDDTKLDTILETKDEKPTVTLPASKGSTVVVGELNGQTVKNMETKDATLEIKTDTVTYTLPASQIDIDSVSSQIGSQVALKDIKVSVKIAEPSADTVKIVEDTANKNSYQLVVKPVEFKINGITSPEQANIFLISYIKLFNEKFGVSPTNSVSAFRSLPDDLNIDHVLCVKHQRLIDNGAVFSFYNKHFKIICAGAVQHIPPKSKIHVLLSPVFGVKAHYKGVYFDTVPFIKSKKMATTSQKTPRTYHSLPDTHYLKHGKDNAPKISFAETDREILDMLEDILFSKYA